MSPVFWVGFKLYAIKSQTETKQWPDSTPTASYLGYFRHRPAAEQLQQVVTQTDQPPFGSYYLQAPQQKPAEAPCLLDLAKDPLDSLPPLLICCLPRFGA